MTKQYYKNYAQPKKQVNEKPSYFKLFLGAFSMMLVLFVIVAIHLCSSIDTAIGENDEGDIKESGLGVRHLIDSRLKFIQMEDTDKLPSTKAPDVIQQKNDTYSQQYNNANDSSSEVNMFGTNSTSYGNNNSYSKNTTTFPNSTNTIKHPVGIQQSTNTRSSVYKVYIGSYSTLEQARVAQSIIQDTNLGVTPYVRTLSNGSYTIQVGSYNDVTKANGVAGDLRRNHFPARMVQE